MMTVLRMALVLASLLGEMLLEMRRMCRPASRK
jgi:hypothetical protein